MSSSPDHQPRRIAVVGSGIAGLTAAYVASRHSEVTLFEGDDRLGGLAATPHVATAVDTGSVHDRRTHPMLQRLLDELGVQPQTAGTSMSVRSEKDAEYAAVRGIHGLLPDRRAARRAHLRMLAEVVRFQRLARALIIAAEPDHRTLDSFLDEHGFTPHFRDHYLAPLVAAVWSCDLAMALDLPVRHLFEFFDHLGVLDAVGSPRWRTVSGGSVTYVDRVAATIRERGGRVRTSTRVVDIVETAAGTEITDGSGHVELFDAVVLATHPAQSLAMLGDSDATQWQILGTDAGLPPADEADSASAQPLGPPSTPPAESEEAPVTGVYRTTIGHARRAHLPVSRFTHPAHWQVVDLGRLPDHGLLGRFEARDRLGDPRRAIRENLDAFLAGHGIAFGDARVLLATQPRALGFCFSPISVYWCTSRSGEPLATVVEVLNPYGARRAHLVRPGDLNVPPPDGRLTLTVRLQTEAGAHVASVRGHRIATAPRLRMLLRAAPAALIGAGRVQAQRIALAIRRLPLRYRPLRGQVGAPREVLG